MQICFVYITSSNLEESKRIARVLVKKKLAACVNIITAMLSFYEWEAKLQEEQEYILIAKSRSDIFDKLKSEVLALHSYSCPCIVMFPIAGGHSDFLAWVRSQTTEPK